MKYFSANKLSITYPKANKQSFKTNKMSYRATYRVPEKSDYYYDNTSNPIEEICKYTDNLEKISPEIRYQMLAAICRQKSSSVYGDFDAPPSKQIIAQINGQGGYFLKKTIEAANIYLIWYNDAKGRYMFWGPSERTVRDAMNRIRGRIVKYVVHLDRSRPKEYENENENADTEEMDYVDPMVPTIDEQYGKTSQTLMNKMGFISGQGLGRNHSGRPNPINPIKDLGGRTHNRQFGLGFTEHAQVPEPDVEHREVAIKNNKLPSFKVQAFYKTTYSSGEVFCTNDESREFYMATNLLKKYLGEENIQVRWEAGVFVVEYIKEDRQFSLEEDLVVVQNICEKFDQYATPYNVKFRMVSDTEPQTVTHWWSVEV